MDNRRKFHRIASNASEPCTVHIDDVQLAGTIADESISGAMIGGLDLLMMPYNKQLSFEIRGASVAARARHVIRDETGQFSLGVVRDETLPPEQRTDSQAMLINCYVKHGDAAVICVPIRYESEAKVLIQLWDGVRFRVPRSQLVPQSRLERFDMLENETCLGFTSGMYGIKNVSPAFDRQQIFEYEFGVYDDCPVAKRELVPTA